MKVGARYGVTSRHAVQTSDGVANASLQNSTAAYLDREPASGTRRLVLQLETAPEAAGLLGGRTGGHV